MKDRRSKIIPILWIAAAGLAACNLPSAAQPPLSLEDQAATIVALTLTPAGTEAVAGPGESSPASPTADLSATPGPSVTPGATATPTLSPTPTITPTYSAPVLTITASTNCRSGPGQSFEVITVLQSGDKAQIVGRYPDNDYWIIKNPDGAGTCWIWGQYSSPGGSYWTVPSMTPPPTPTLSPPIGPRNLSYTYECTYGATGLDVTANLKWTDRANNELGYRVFRSENLVIDLPPDSNSYTDYVTINYGEGLSYRVEVYNDTGSASSNTISFTCK